MKSKLYNVTVRVVDLVWAASEADAIAITTRHLSWRGWEVLPDGQNAFLSEPAPCLGWEGEIE